MVAIRKQTALAFLSNRGALLNLIEVFRFPHPAKGRSEAQLEFSARPLLRPSGES